MQCDSFNRNDRTCELQLSHNILAERHKKGADGGERGSCRRNMVMISPTRWCWWWLLARQTWW